MPRVPVAIVNLLCLGSMLLATMWPPRALAQLSEPIRLNAHNPHYFVYRGKTIALISSGEHYGAVVNRQFDDERYLDTLEQAGLNYTRLFGGSYLEVPGQSFAIQRNTLAPVAAQLISPWQRTGKPAKTGGDSRFDLDRWNPEYFKRLHSFLLSSERRGIIVEISLFSSSYAETQWRVSPFNRANNVNETEPVAWRDLYTLGNRKLLAYQEQYTRKLVAEAGVFPNVIFEVQNEPWADRPTLAGVVNAYLPVPNRDLFPNSIDLADAASLAWQARVVSWIRDAERTFAHPHLIAQNFCNFGLPAASILPGVSVLNIHYAYPEAASANLSLRVAIADDETGFLGQDNDAYRRQAWNFLLSGGSTFNGLDYTFTVGHEDGGDTELNGPGGGGPAFRRQLGLLAVFLRSLPLEAMQLDTRSVPYAGGARARVLSGGGVYAIYLDGTAPTRLTLSLPPGRFSGEWMDTRSGERRTLASVATHRGSITLQSPAGMTEVALRLLRQR